MTDSREDIAFDGVDMRQTWPIEHQPDHDPLVMWFDCDTCDDLADGDDPDGAYDYPGSREDFERNER